MHIEASIAHVASTLVVKRSWLVVDCVSLFVPNKGRKRKERYNIKAWNAKDAEGKYVGTGAQAPDAVVVGPFL